ncbi:MAG TPA: phosphodiester glycosidase family protein [Caldimonas sp.]
MNRPPAPSCSSFGRLPLPTTAFRRSNGDQEMNWRIIGSIVCAAVATLASRCLLAAPGVNCDAIRAPVDRTLVWNPLAPGLEFARVDIKSEFLQDLTLIRYANAAYQARPFDLRDVVSASQSKGYYAPPLFSVKELQRSLRQATLIASAGMSKSYSEPLPAGLLRIDGNTRAPLAPKDKILDGVVCLAQDGRMSILSEIETGFRRSPANVDRCYAGFQAGPVLVADGVPTAQDHKLKTSRVFLGLAAENTVIGFSALATTAALGCVMTSPKLAIANAINLQGDTLGGIGLGAPFSSVAPAIGLGNTDATIASALVVESRSMPKMRAKKR